MIDVLNFAKRYYHRKYDTEGTHVSDYICASYLYWDEYMKVDGYSHRNIGDYDGDQDYLDVRSL